MHSTAGVRLLGPQKRTRLRRAIVWYWIDNLCRSAQEQYHRGIVYIRYLSFLNMKCKHHPSLKCGLWSTSECLAYVNPHPYSTVLRPKFSFQHCRRTLTNRDVQEIRYTTQSTSYFVIEIFPDCHRSTCISFKKIVSRFENTLITFGINRGSDLLLAPRPWFRHTVGNKYCIPTTFFCI